MYAYYPCLLAGMQPCAIRMDLSLVVVTLCCWTPVISATWSKNNDRHCMTETVRNCDRH